MLVLFFFFFQAEDGIRDLYVTGVQTCALPIWARRPSSRPTRSSPVTTPMRSRPPSLRRRPTSARSEERRVGKECRSRWSPEHEKKNGIEKWYEHTDRKCMIHCKTDVVVSPDAG